MNIFVVRHGESDKLQNINDWQYPLTDKGVRQSLYAGNFLNSFFTQNNLNLNDSIIIYSPYIRTRLTADAINKNISIKTKCLPSLAEYQKSQKITDIEEVVNYNEALKKSINALCFQDSADINMHESPLEIVLRAKLVIKHLADLNYENIILVTHNGFIRAFDIAFLDKPITEYFSEQKIRSCSIRHYEITLNNEHLYHGEILQKIKKEDLLEDSKEC